MIFGFLFVWKNNLFDTFFLQRELFYTMCLQIPESTFFVFWRLYPEIKGSTDLEKAVIIGFGTLPEIAKAFLATRWILG